MTKANKKVVKGGASKRKRETRAEIAAPPPAKKKLGAEEAEPEVPRVPLRSLPPKAARRKRGKSQGVTEDDPPPIPENEDDGEWVAPKLGEKVVEIPHSMKFDTRKKTLEVRCNMPRVPLDKLLVNPTRTTLRISTLGFSKKYYLAAPYKGNVWCDAKEAKVDYDHHVLAISIPVTYMPKAAKEEQRRISSSVVKGNSKKFEEEMSKGWKQLVESAKEDEELVAAALEAEQAEPVKLSKKQKRRRAKSAKKNPPQAEPEAKKVPTSKTKKQMKKDRRKKNWEARTTGDVPLKAMNVTPSELNVSGNAGNLSAVASVPEAVVKKAPSGRSRKVKLFLDDNEGMKSVMEKQAEAQQEKVEKSQYKLTLMQQVRQDQKMERTIRREEKRDKKNRGKGGKKGGEEKSKEG